MKTTTRDKTAIGIGVFVIFLWMTMVAGWISNIVQLIGYGEIDPLFWVKLICVVAAPVGSILGIVGWF